MFLDTKQRIKLENDEWGDYEARDDDDDVDDMLKEEEQTFMPPLALNLVYGN